MTPSKPLTLLDLPKKHLPADRDAACGTDGIQDAYLRGRKTIKSVRMLRTFVAKWRNLWFLTCPDLPPAAPCVWLDAEGLNWDTVVKLLATSVDEQADALGLRGDPAARTLEQLAATDIIAPPALVAATVVGHTFGVGTDLGMVRLYLDPWPELNDEMRQ